MHLSASLALFEHEPAALRAKVDNEHLVGAKDNAALPFAIEAFCPWRIPHAHSDIVFSGRQHKTLIDARRPVAGNPGGRQRSAISNGIAYIKFDIDGAASARTILHAAHIGRELRDLLRREAAAFSAAIRAVHEGQHDNTRVRGRLPIAWPVGKGGDAREQRDDDRELTENANCPDHGPTRSTCGSLRATEGEAAVIVENGDRFMGGSCATSRWNAATCRSSRLVCRAEAQTVRRRARGTRARKCGSRIAAKRCCDQEIPSRL